MLFMIITIIFTELETTYDRKSLIYGVGVYYYYNCIHAGKTGTSIPDDVSGTRAPRVAATGILLLYNITL